MTLTGSLHSLRARRARTVGMGLLLGVLALVVAPASPASAHAALVGSDPGANSVVASAPAQVVLTFTESVTPVANRVHVIGPSGKNVDAGSPRAEGTKLIISLGPEAVDGTFLVNYRVISADSHPVGGAFSFSIGAPSPGGPPTAADGGNQSSNPLIRTLFPVARWIGYVGLMLFVGAVLFLWLLWPRRLDRDGAIRVIWLGAGMIGVSALLELALQVPYVSGGSLDQVNAEVFREVIGSQYGATHLVRLGVLASALLLVQPIARGRSWGADRVLLAVLGAVGVATWSVSGHPSASPVPMTTVVADMLHIAAMSVWLGGLIMLIGFLLPRGSAYELASILPVWSRWAAYAVAVLILTGVAQALLEIGSFTAFVTTVYGWLVLAKVGLVGLLLLVALQSRRMVAVIASGIDGSLGWPDTRDDENERDRADVPESAYAVAASGPSGGLTRPTKSFVDLGDGQVAELGTSNRRAVRRLRGLVVAEVLVAVVILGVTSVLVQTSPDRSAAAAPVPQTATMVDNLFTLTIEVAPGRVGLNDIQLSAASPDGLPIDVKQWKIRASAPELGIEPIDASVQPLQADRAAAQIGIPAAGVWTFAFTLRTTDLDESTVTAQVKIVQ